MSKDFIREERGVIQEYLQLLVFFAFLIMLMMLLSYHPDDLSDLLIVYRFDKIILPHHNLFGPLGANVSEWLFQIFGLLAPFSFVIAALQVCNSILRKKPGAILLIRFLGLVQFIVFSSVIGHQTIGQLSYRSSTILATGLLGVQFSKYLSHYLGDLGALLLAVFGVVSALPLLAGFRTLVLFRALLSLMPGNSSRNLSLALKDTDKGSVAKVGFVETPESHEGRWAKLAKPHPKSETDSHTGLLRQAIAQDPGEVPRGSAPATVEHMILPRYKLEKAQVLSAGALLDLLVDHLVEGQEKRRDEEKKRLVEEAKLLLEKLETFGITGSVVRSQPGPVVNVHEFEPAPGIKVGKVLALQEDLALGLKARSVLMAPQPGKSTIGIELPAHFREVVSLKEVISSQEFQSLEKPLKMVLGKTVEGSPLVGDLSSMPHLLVAGATGSGKSVAINVILLSLLISRRPDELRLILVDPKMLELSNYDGIGHLLLPVVTEPQKAAGALKWALAEMDRRYALLKNAQVRNIESFNSLSSEERQGDKLPFIVVVIDELCDLMMTAPKEVEDSVQRLAQKARASGIHLILATQRPSVDVLTGVIKANLPCRISFQVASKHDSRTIIETMGAEKLLGKGDMLYLPPGTNKIVRAHGAFVSDDEVNRVCEVLRKNYPARYETGVMSEVDQASTKIAESRGPHDSALQGQLEDSAAVSEDELYAQVVDFAMSSGKVSTSSIQRHFRIGYNKAARLMDRMDHDGLVGPSDIAGKPREVKVGR